MKNKPRKQIIEDIDVMQEGPSLGESEDVVAGGERRTLVRFSEDEHREIKARAEATGETLPAVLKRSFFGGEWSRPLLQTDRYGKILVTVDIVLKSVVNFAAGLVCFVDRIAIRIGIGICVIAGLTTMVHEPAFQHTRWANLLRKLNGPIPYRAEPAPANDFDQRQEEERSYGKSDAETKQMEMRTPADELDRAEDEAEPVFNVE